MCARKAELHCFARIDSVNRLVGQYNLLRERFARGCVAPFGTLLDEHRSLCLLRLDRPNLFLELSLLNQFRKACCSPVFLVLGTTGEGF